MKNLLVVTPEPVDLGAGPHTSHTFVGCVPHIDDKGTLHIRRDPDRYPQQRGNVGAFADGKWDALLTEAQVIADDIQATVTPESGAA